MEDLTSKKFGHLTVVGVDGKTTRGQYIWKCKCDCGNYKSIRGYHLKGKKTRSCGCLKRETVNIKWSGYGDIGRWVWNRFRIGAYRRSLEFNLTPQDMWELALKQNLKCSLTNIPLVFVKRPRYQNQSNVSLDRIDSSKGYIKGNVQWVTKNVNVAKQSMSQEEFINICKLVTLNNNF